MFDSLFVAKLCPKWQEDIIKLENPSLLLISKTLKVVIITNNYSLRQFLCLNNYHVVQKFSAKVKSTHQLVKFLPI